MRRNKGITLIALVITIIVLLILAGVAISMLSGENGILRKAAEAKTKTEEKSLEEQIKLAVMGAIDAGTSKVDKQKIADELGIDKKSINGDAKDIVLTKGDKTYNLKNGKLEEVSPIKEIDNVLDEYFQERGLNYKCRYGYITGVNVNDEIEAETAEKLNQLLKYKGYVLRNTENTADVADDAKLTTGMVVTKQNETEVLARTILFGDINGTGKIDISDVTLFKHFLTYDEEKQKSEYKEYQLVTMDINCDRKIGQKDFELLSEYVAFKNECPIDQNQYACNSSDIIFKDRNKVLTEYIDSLTEKMKNNTKYSLEKSNDSESDAPYVFKGVERGTTKASELLSILPEGTLVVAHNTSKLNIDSDVILNNSDDDTIEEDFTLRGKEYKHGIAIKDEFVGDIVIAYFE